MSKINWRNGDPAKQICRAYIFVGNNGINYWAEVPSNMTLEQIAADLAAGFDHEGNDEIAVELYYSEGDCSFIIKDKKVHSFKRI